MRAGVSFVLSMQQLAHRRRSAPPTRNAFRYSIASPPLRRNGHRVADAGDRFALPRRQRARAARPFAQKSRFCSDRLAASGDSRCPQSNAGRSSRSRSRRSGRPAFSHRKEQHAAVVHSSARGHSHPSPCCSSTDLLAERTKVARDDQVVISRRADAEVLEMCRCSVVDRPPGPSRRPCCSRRLMPRSTMRPIGRARDAYGPCDPRPTTTAPGGRSTVHCAVGVRWPP